MVTMFRALFVVGNHKKALINKKSWIVFSPIGKFLTVAYKVPYFKMIRLYLDIEDSLHFLSFVQTIKRAKYPNSNHISSSVGMRFKMVWDLIMALQLISMFKTLNEFKVLWSKVVSIGSYHIFRLFSLSVTTKLTLFSKIHGFSISSKSCNLCCEAPNHKFVTIFSI